MNKNARKVVLVTAFMISIALLSLITVIYIVKAAQDELVILDISNEISDVAKLPGIAEEDYADYELDSVYYNYVYRPYMLTAKDAAVIAAKQAEEILGMSFKGLYSKMVLIQGELWNASAINDQSGTIVYGASVDAVSGQIRQLFVYSDTDEQREFTNEDIDACRENAFAVAEKYFAYDKSRFGQETQEYFADYKGDDIVVNGNICYINFALNNTGINKMVFFYYLPDRKLLSMEMYDY